MRRIFVLIVRATQSQVDEWIEDGGLFYGVGVLKIVRAGSHGSLRIVEYEPTEQTEAPEEAKP